MTDPNKAWRCDECGTCHLHRRSAIDCCEPTVTEGYVCATCETFYEEEDKAIACCVQVEPEEQRPPTAEELEAAGQVRLLP